MEEELQRKIQWLEKRHKDLHDTVESIESHPHSMYNSEIKNQLSSLKKEKLRVKDLIAMMKKLEK